MRLRVYWHFGSALVPAAQIPGLGGRDRQPDLLAQAAGCQSLCWGDSATWRLCWPSSPGWPHCPTWPGTAQTWACVGQRAALGGRRLPPVPVFRFFLNVASDRKPNWRRNGDGGECGFPIGGR
jgi:hypothetical protein